MKKKHFWKKIFLITLIVLSKLPLAQAQISSNQNFEIFFSNEMYGLKYEGKTVIQPQYKKLKWLDKKAGLLIAEIGKNEGVISNQNKTILEIKYDDIEGVEYNRIIVSIGDEMGVADYNGKFIIQPLYENILLIEDLDNDPSLPLFVVKSRSTKYGLIDINGNQIQEPQFDDIAGKSSEGRIAYWVDKKIGLFDAHGNVVMKPIYDAMGYFNNGLCPVTKNGLDGYIDPFGKVAIPIKYEEAWNFTNELAAVKKNGKWGFIDLNGEMVIPCIYSKVRSFYEGKAFVSKTPEDNDSFYDESNYGVINKNNELILPFKYCFNSATDEKRFKEGKVWVNICSDKDDTDYLINDKGEILKQR
jgi:WG repeat protein